MLCKVLRVPRSSYYQGLKQQEPSERQKQNAVLIEKIKEVFDKHKGRYGSPRIHRELKKKQLPCSLGRVKRLMRQEGLYAVTTPKYRLKQERHEVGQSRNLLLEEGVELKAINQVWLSDITYVPTDEGWLYLAGVMDAYSRRIVGYAMEEHMKTELVVQALAGAVKRRKPAAGLIHHCDRGSQYTAYAYQQQLAQRGMLASFTGKGACFDNAVIESFWATLKRELLHTQKRFATRAEARAAIFEFIEVYYNRERLHSSLGYETPEAFEAIQSLPLQDLAA